LGQSIYMKIKQLSKHWIVISPKGKVDFSTLSERKSDAEFQMSFQHISDGYKVIKVNVNFEEVKNKKI
jgi:hypothetical protein